MRDSLVCHIHKPSTERNYHGIWTNFNRFVIRLDNIPTTWEDKVSLYCTFLTIYTTIQSSTLKSYISAIKSKLRAIGHNWNNNQALLSALTRACKIKNDVVRTRLPIGLSLLDCICFEIERNIWDHYQRILYLTALLVAYYGLLRIGEYTESQHVMKASKVYLADNKTKLLITLTSSKTHDKESRPQKIKIEARTKGKKRVYCPIEQVQEYIKIRPRYRNDNEQFFVFEDGAPVTPYHIRALLQLMLEKLDLDPSLYETHSLRIGRATDLFKAGHSIEAIKRKGRWKSNAVYRYLRE